MPYLKGFHILKQHIIGTVNLSVPLIVLFQLYPSIFFMWQGLLVLAFLLGTYIWYLNKMQMHNASVYVPSGEYKSNLEEMIRAAGMNPNDVQLRYGYTQEQVAMVINKTLVIDPVVWQGYENDNGAQQVITIFNIHINPTLTSNARTRLALCKQALTSSAQRFIFRHELGHIYQHYAIKKLAVIWLIGCSAAYAGIMAAMYVVPFNGFIAIAAGIIVGGITDLLLTYTSNLVFKLYQERQADLFALQYSTSAETQAAALFFEKYQEIIDNHKDTTLLSVFPSIIVTGHMNGKARGQWLRKMANSQNT